MLDHRAWLKILAPRLVFTLLLTPSASTKERKVPRVLCSCPEVDQDEKEKEKTSVMSAVKHQKWKLAIGWSVSSDTPSLLDFVCSVHKVNINDFVHLFFFL